MAGEIYRSLKRQLMDDFVEPAVGLGEAALTVGTGLASMLNPLTGYKAAARAALGQYVGDYVEAEHAKSTYIPRTEEGMRNLQGMGRGIESFVAGAEAAPVVGSMLRGASEVAEWNPVLGAAGYTGTYLLGPGELKAVGAGVGTALKAVAVPAMVKAGSNAAKPSTLRLTHFSHKPDLEVIDPAFHGTGGAGQEMAAKRGYPEYFQDRVYMGVNEGMPGGYRRESMVGPHKYTFEHPSEWYYDMRADPENLRAQIPNDLPQAARVPYYEKLAKDAGYLGWNIDNQAVSFFPLDAKTGKPIGWSPKGAAQPEAPPNVALSPMADKRTADNVMARNVMSPEGTPPEVADAKFRSAIDDWHDWTAKKLGYKDGAEYSTAMRGQEAAYDAWIENPQALKDALDGDYAAIRDIGWAEDSLADKRLIPAEELNAVPMRERLPMIDHNKSRIEHKVATAIAQREFQGGFLLRQKEYKQRVAELEAMSRPDLQREIDKVFDLGTTQERAARRGLSVVPEAPPAPTGPTTINIGLNIGDQVGALSERRIRDALKEIGVHVQRRQIKQPTGPGDEPTFIAELDRPLTAQEAHDLSVALDQEAIPQRVGDQGELYGPSAEKWGPYNPELFKELDDLPETFVQDSALRSSKRKKKDQNLRETGEKVKREDLAASPERMRSRIQRSNDLLDQDPRPLFNPDEARRTSIFPRDLIDDAMEGHPGVAQRNIEREAPKTQKTADKIDERVQEIFYEPENRKLIERQIQHGRELGGDTYYPSTYALRGFLEERLPNGRQIFDQNMNVHAGTSSQTALPNNMANQSLMMHAIARGIDPGDYQAIKALGEELAAQRGHANYYLGPSHADNSRSLLLGESWVGQKDKVQSYNQNLLGNFEPTPMDTHEVKGLSMGSPHYPHYERAKTLDANEYGALEAGYQDVAASLGLRPANAQAGRWFGGGPLTGLKAGSGDWLSTFEHMVRYTAEQLGTGMKRSQLQDLALKILTGKEAMLPWYPTKANKLPPLRKKVEAGFVDKDMLKVLAGLGVAGAAGYSLLDEGKPRAKKVKRKSADLLEEIGE